MSNTPLGAGRSDTQLVRDERVIFVSPKNRSTEYRITIKLQKTHLTEKMQNFMDLREWWFKNGPLEKPIPTKRGVMFHREMVPKMIVALLCELKPDEVDKEVIDSIRAQLVRLERKID